MVVAYWVKDESESFENTTQFIDHSLAVMESLLHSDILSKGSNLGMFFVKTHLLSSLKNLSGKKEKFSSIKRKLGEILHEK
jgi:hypothetical protein